MKEALVKAHDIRIDESRLLHWTQVLTFFGWWRQVGKIPNDAVVQEVATPLCRVTINVGARPAFVYLS